MRVVVIGASGQLGADLMRAFADLKPIGVDHRMFDIEISASISKLLTQYRPELVINTAAFHNVELCETQPGRAFAVNALAVDGLAGQCAAAGAIFTHISTDYVFDGAAREAYPETAATNPLSAYGVSKVAGELLIWRHTPRAYVIRTSGLYGIRGSSTKGYTFIERTLRAAESGTPLRVVTDITFSPSYTRHVATAIRQIIDAGSFGTYHVTNTGECSWYDFAREILRQAKFGADIEPVTSEAFPTLVRRPLYSALAPRAMQSLGLPLAPRWEDGIAEYLAERAT